MKPILEKLLLAYIRSFPIRRGKYRLVERFGRGGKGQHGFIRRARLKYGGYEMDCDLRMMLQRQFYFFGTYFLEERVLARWSELAKDARFVLDIGANAGIFSLAAAASSPTSQIHAFEPTPEIVRHFQQTVEHNLLGGRISIHQCAVAQESGFAFLNFFSGEHEDNEGMNFVSFNEGRAGAVRVAVTSIDDFCSEQGIAAVDLVKIDVQGKEADVLAGSERSLRDKLIGTLFLELNWDLGHSPDCAASKVVRRLEDAGYGFADPNRVGDLVFRPAGPWLNSLSDVIASARLGPGAVGTSHPKGNR